MSVYLTQEQFLERAKKLWKDKFDYSLVVYTGVKNKIILICPTHGKFKQQAGGHLYGKDCPKCAKLKSNRFYFVSRRNALK